MTAIAFWAFPDRELSRPLLKYMSNVTLFLNMIREWDGVLIHSSGQQ